MLDRRSRRSHFWERSIVSTLWWMRLWVISSPSCGFHELGNRGGGNFYFSIIWYLETRPIRYFERKLPGGIGVVMDDVLAGILAMVILQIIYAKTTWLDCSCDFWLWVCACGFCLRVGGSYSLPLRQWVCLALFCHPIFNLLLQFCAQLALSSLIKYLSKKLLIYFIFLLTGFSSSKLCH